MNFYFSMKEPTQPKFESAEYHVDALLLALRNGTYISEDKKNEIIHLLEQQLAPQTKPDTINTPTKSASYDAIKVALADMSSYVQNNDGRPQLNDPQIKDLKSNEARLAIANAAMADEALRVLKTSSDPRQIQRTIEYFAAMNKGFATFDHGPIIGISPERKNELQNAMARLCKRCLQDSFLKTDFGFRFVYSLISYTRQEYYEVFNGMTRQEFDKLFVEIDRAINAHNPELRDAKKDAENYAKYKAAAAVFLQQKYGV